MNSKGLYRIHPQQTDFVYRRPKYGSIFTFLRSNDKDHTDKLKNILHLEIFVCIYWYGSSIYQVTWYVLNWRDIERNLLFLYELENRINCLIILWQSGFSFLVQVVFLIKCLRFWNYPVLLFISSFYRQTFPLLLHRWNLLHWQSCC